MVDDIRFVAFAAALFVVSFGSVAWINAGAPVPAFSRLFPVPEIGLAGGPIPEPRISGSDGNIGRDMLRVAALQASKDYVLAPCDRTAKANLVAAVSAYATAWREVMGCGPNGCDPRRLNAAAAAFSTPLDSRVREALAAAFDKRGVSIDDFPSALRINLAMLVPGRGDAASACPETRAEIAR